MKILYGINGTGNGHIIKSINIISELKKLGVDVDILVSGTNHQINIPYDINYKLHGVSFEYTKNGSVDYIKTALNLRPAAFIKDIRLDVKSYDKVVTDFEPVTAWACKLSKKDCIGVSHQYSFLSDKSPRPDISLIGEFVLNKLAPVSEPIGLHFNKYDSFIKHPVIRTDIVNSKPNDFGYYTVYLPSYNTKMVIHELSKYSEDFHIFSKEVTKSLSIKNITIFPSSIKRFMESFINCKGVITSAGFETPSEAIYMNKRLLVIPIRGQYEQLCNAKSLSDMGIAVGRDINDIPKIFDNDFKLNYEWDNPMNSIIESILRGS